MNNPSPLVPQGSFLEQKNKSRARVRIAVFFVLSIHVVGLMALLMQGCRREEPVTEPQAPTETNLALPTFDETNLPAGSSNIQTIVSNPTPAETVTPLPPATQEYTIARGDTLSAIAKKFPGVTWKQIQDANPGIDPNRLQPGRKLVIPAPASAPTAGASNTTPGMAENSSGDQIYTVKSGDTLTKIASQFGTTVRAIRSLNSLTTDRIQVGQKLKMPAKAGGAAPVTTAPATNL